MQIKSQSIELVSVDALIPHPKNIHKHPPEQIGKILAYRMTKIGFPHHFVSKCGRLYSEKYGAGKIGKIREMKTGIVSGYRQASMRINGKNKHIKTHRAVALMFIENPYKYQQVNHKDGNKLNNHVSNLEWSTPKQNTQHAINTGLRKTKCDEFKILSLKTFMINGCTDKELASLFGLKRHYCNSLRNGHYWKAITCMK